MALRYRIVFFGSSAFACPSLDRLLESAGNEPVAVVCQCDKPSGRDRRSSPCVVKRHLSSRRIPLLTPRDVNTPESIAALQKLCADFFVVVSYGQLLKPAVLAIPTLGSINVHASLLPKYRGAAPIQWAIACGETITGVTTMLLNEKMDAGDIVGRREEPILPEDTATTLHDRLAELGAGLLLRTLEDFRNGSARPQPQAHAQATFAPKLKKTDARLDWHQPAEALHNRIRAFVPWPGACFERPPASGKLISAIKAMAEPCRVEAEPGTVLEIDASGILVKTGKDALRLIEIKPESRPAMTAAAFARGRAIKPGDRFG